MRRARIQVKPNISKAAKQQTPVVSAPAPAPAPPPAPEAELEAPPPTQRIPEDVVMENQNPEEPPSESMKSLHVDVQGHKNHVHFDDNVIDNEQIRNHSMNAEGIVSLSSPTSINNNNIQFATPHAPGRLMTPRSRNVSMCEDESILQPKPAREKKRFSGKEELDTKTWKMSDLTRWNPRNEQTSFKRERRSSTSSTIITKSELGDFDSPAAPRVNAPQVKIGLDGRLVIDESSLVMQSAQITHESMWETVEEGRMGSKITSMSFRTKIFRKPNFWSEKETDLFYEVLQCTGQDFGLMHHYLPQRSRPELKAKYNREERQNWGRLLKAISHPVRLDGDLEVRIAKFMAEMEEEKNEKKAKSDWEKTEEKRIREESRLQKAAEKNEDKQKKMQARELVKKARDLEKDARIAAKLNLKANEKAEKEAKARELSETREAEKEAKLKERQDAKVMALEAKRIAIEARNIIKESRKVENLMKKEAKIQAESHNLEREAERIIRRLIQESQREERRAAKDRRTPKKKSPNTPSTSSPAAPSAPNDTVDPMETGGETHESDEESSESPESSDGEAVSKDTARREKARMKEERRSLEPRSEKKPVYVTKHDIKYSEVEITQTVSIALANNGRIFDSADEDDDEVRQNPQEGSAPPKTSDDPAPPEEKEDPKVDDSVPGPSPKPSTSSSPPVIAPKKPSRRVKKTPVKIPKTPEKETPEKKTPEKKASEEKKMEEEEPVPQAVFDVIEELVKNKNRNSEVDGADGGDKMEEEKKDEEKKNEEEEEDSEEPPKKMARVEETPDASIIDVVGSDSKEGSPMDTDEIIDVVTVDSNEESSQPSSSSSIPSTSQQAPPTTSSSAPRSLATRTVKRPVTWVTKPKKE
ncbi:hypothetical protein CAEBREN_06076 [Caenorhabditis brenneri]|uniref:Transcription factor TFIIIB component B'' Myb domain-containing protein n=1 Tax=Caenorhabditis brenneri TaxID=135651 RepID=G0NVH5_CAEBE|nr:hypothetical protein CAEBREN_06076 [Caenorhabditis brenneri]